jgi:hypothetical protein
MNGPHVLVCLGCHRPFDFAHGETAIVVRHVRFAVRGPVNEVEVDQDQGRFVYLEEIHPGGRDYGLAHDGACVAAVSTLAPATSTDEYTAAGRDLERLRVLEVRPANGWAVVLLMDSGSVTLEPLLCWAVVRYQDGSRRLEGIIRAASATDGQETLEFPEARPGHLKPLGYAPPPEHSDPASRTCRVDADTAGRTYPLTTSALG